MGGRKEQRESYYVCIFLFHLKLSCYPSLEKLLESFWASIFCLSRTFFSLNTALLRNMMLVAIHTTEKEQMKW